MKELILVGAGHAHLLLLARGPRPRARITLVSPRRVHLYSGMLSGWLSGRHAPADLSLDLGELAARAGASFLEAEVTSLTADSRLITLADGRALPYDLASLAVGSAASTLPGRGSAEVLKPVDGALEALAPVLVGNGVLLIVGGGAAGVELALCARARTGRPVVLVSAGPSVPTGGSPALQRRVAALLRTRGIDCRLGTRVTALEPHEAALSTGEVQAFSTCLWVGRAEPPAFLAASGAAVDARGFLLVSDALQSTSHPSLFASGDCVAFASGQRVSRAGVQAVRAAPALARNLQVALSGTGRLRRFRAAARPLALLDTGEGTALLDWKGLAAEGRALLGLKDRIDRGFMRRIRAPLFD